MKNLPETLLASFVRSLASSEPVLDMSNRIVECIPVLQDCSNITFQHSFISLLTHFAFSRAKAKGGSPLSRAVKAHWQPASRIQPEEGGGQDQDSKGQAGAGSTPADTGLLFFQRKFAQLGLTKYALQRLLLSA